LLSGLLNTDSALTLISFSGRADADGFFFAIFILHAIYVDNQQDRLRCGSNGVPPLFARHDAILAEDCLGIVENECSGLECYATVLKLVNPVVAVHQIAPLYKLYNIKNRGSQRKRLDTERLEIVARRLRAVLKLAREPDETMV